jgi:hypothetical protein
LRKLNNDWEDVTKNAFLLYNTSSAKTAKNLRKFYFGFELPNAEIGMKDLGRLTDAFSDRYFVSGVRDAALLHSQHASTHLYYFSYQGALGFAPVIKAAAQSNGTVSLFINLMQDLVMTKVYQILGWDVVNYGNLKCCYA